VILFALLRAVALPISVAIAFGLQVPNANWMPIATIVAMKPSLQQSALVAEQRVAGTIRAMNYALYVAASAAVVLIAADLPNRSNLTAEGRRICSPSSASASPSSSCSWRACCKSAPPKQHPNHPRPVRRDASDDADGAQTLGTILTRASCTNLSRSASC
jgi:hypothetical protein